MQAIQEEQPQLPRFDPKFIGIGHQLEARRKERRRVEAEERAMANRVIFLEKEEQRAEKALRRKRDEFGRLMSVAERQQQEKELRQRTMADRERQLQIAREENRLRRLLHKQNQQHSEALVSARRSLQYKTGKNQLLRGESRKREEQKEHLLAKQERYQSLNAKREQGRSRIDQFFKKRNSQHTRTYRDKINREEGTTRTKKETIEKLAEIETVLRKRLEESSMRVSQMDQVLGDLSLTFKDKSSSRLSLRHSLSPHNDPLEPSLITSVQGQLLGKGQVEQQLQIGQPQGGGVSEGGKMRRRRRNKHVNRYKQYELY